MIKRTILVGAGLASLGAMPAKAQVVGEWQYELFPGEPASIRITRDRAHPERMYATGELHGSLIAFVGEYRNLRWYGTWYWYGPANARMPSLRACAAAVAPRPGAPGYGQRTTHTGGFEFTFNAAESQIHGSWKSACSGADGRAESGQPIDFSAIRMNTYTTAAPQTRQFDGSSAGTGSASGGGEPTPVGDLDRNEEPCAEVARFKISSNGSGSAPDTVFSNRYRIRPCLTTAGQKIQIDMPNPEGKRPIRVFLQALRMTQQINGLRPVLIAIPTGATHQQGLPFIGEPRAGQAIMNIPMAGRICSAPLWEAWLDFSDGTRSREPIGAIVSVCGMRAHPELMPARSSGGEGARPAGELRPAGG